MLGGAESFKILQSLSLYKCQQRAFFCYGVDRHYHLFAMKHIDYFDYIVDAAIQTGDPYCCRI